VRAHHTATHSSRLAGAKLAGARDRELVLKGPDRDSLSRRWQCCGERVKEWATHPDG
jgi:hypothetical protein